LASTQLKIRSPKGMCKDEFSTSHPAYTTSS
jgi:hypothetical protein